MKARLSAALALFVFPVSLAAAPARFQGPVVCFYGRPPLDQLARFPTVVLQPSLVAASDVAFLQSKGCRVLGYVSLGEDDRLRRGNGKGPGGYAPWYIDEHAGPGFDHVGPDGHPDSNPAWGSYYVDASDRGWRRLVRDEVRRIHQELHMDGVFADTLTVPPDVFTTDRERRMNRGLLSLERALKSWSSGGIVILNNGDADTAALRGVDGVMIETDLKALETDADDVRLAVARLDPLRRSRGLVLTGLLYISPGLASTDVCRALAPLQLPAALYRSDAAGQALTSLPFATCP